MRGSIERLGTAAKLLLALSLFMLPIGGALMWSALSKIETTNQTLAAAAAQRAQLSARAIEQLIARNALALRVAVNGALDQGGAACTEAARTLAIAPGLSRRFEIEDRTGRPLCAVGDFSDITQPPRTAPGSISVWIAEDERSLFLRTGVENGSATARIEQAELRAALLSEGSTFAAAGIDDGRKRVLLIGGPDQLGADSPGARHRFSLGGGRIDAVIVGPDEKITTAERLLILMPVIMWAIAALVTWALVHRLLIEPLRKLQRGVMAFDPGDDPALLADIELRPANEIADLRDAFVRAVTRIEETERGMAEALEGQRKLVREVHHRVKNNLQVVASLLSIHGRSAASAEGKAAFAAIGRRVDALSVVHRNHYAELEDNQGIALRALLNELGAGLKAGDVPRGLSISIDTDQASTTQDVAVAVAFLVTEVIEYAMLTGAGSSVEIILRRVSPLTGRLTMISEALLETAEMTPQRQQFERIVEGLARQLRSPLDRSLGRYSVDLPLFPDRG